MTTIELKKISKAIGDEVVAAIKSEKIIVKYLSEYAPSIHLWREDADVKMQIGKWHYAKQAFERIVNNYPHLFKQATFSKQYEVWTLWYADALIKRMRDNEKAYHEQAEREIAAYKPVMELKERLSKKEDVDGLTKEYTFEKPNYYNNGKAYRFSPYWWMVDFLCYCPPYGVLCPLDLESEISKMLEKYHVPFRIEKTTDNRMYVHNTYRHPYTTQQPYWND